MWLCYILTMPIYTRSGDRGDTGLANGQRVSKSSAVINFVGELDSLNASIGLCVAMLTNESEDFTLECEVLESIQSDLFCVGAVAVGANFHFDASEETENIEKTIDDYEELLPKLKNFILPGGSITAAQLHDTRTLIRKIERMCVELKSNALNEFLPYLNRLSDLFFVMARYVNKQLGCKEKMWKS